MAARYDIELANQGYQTINAIGAGTFGRTLLVRRIVDGALRAAKMVNLTNLASDDVLAAQREPQFLESLTCPSIVKMDHYFFIDQETELVLIMEYCQGGDMAKLLNHMQTMNVMFTEAEIRKMLRQMVEALAHVHDVCVLHRDLKPSNVLIGADGSLKLADFGVSRKLNATLQRANTHVGTPQYMPPEMILTRGYSFPGDIWSLGCVLYEMICLRPAFNGQNHYAIGMAIHFLNPAPIGPQWSQPLRDIVTRILAKNPVERPSARDLLATPYLSDIPDPLAAIVAWDHPDHILDAVREQDEEHAGYMSSDIEVTTAVGTGVSSQTTDSTDDTPEPVLYNSRPVEMVHVFHAEVILWRIHRALQRKKVPWLRAMLKIEPKIWQTFLTGAEEMTKTLQSEISVEQVAETILDSILDMDNGAPHGGWAETSAGGPSLGAWTEARVTPEWIHKASEVHDAGLSADECELVLEVTQKVLRTGTVTLQHLERACENIGTLMNEYRPAGLGQNTNNDILSEVECAYTRLCSIIYVARSAIESQNERILSQSSDSQGGVPPQIVRDHIERSEHLRMHKEDIEMFLLMASKTRDGRIRWRKTTSEMAKHSALLEAVAKETPEVSTKMALLQATFNSGRSGSAIASGTEVRSATPDSQMEPTPSVIHSEMQSEALSDSSTEDCDRQSLSIDHSQDCSSSRPGLCQHCLSRPSGTAANRSFLSAEGSFTGGWRLQDHSLFSDQGSEYSDANPEIELKSPSERSEVLTLNRVSTLPAEHFGGWQERPAFVSRYVPTRQTINEAHSRQNRPSHGPSSRPSGNISSKSSNHRTSAPAVTKASVHSRPEIHVRASRDGVPALRSIGRRELAEYPLYDPNRISNEQGTYLHLIFPSSTCQIPSEPRNLPSCHEPRLTVEVVVDRMVEALRCHEAIIEMMITSHIEPYITEKQLKESIAALIEEIGKTDNQQEELLEHINRPALAANDRAASLQEMFVRTYGRSLRYQRGLTQELTSLMASSPPDGRSGGGRHGTWRQAYSPASSGSNGDRAALLVDRVKPCVLCTAVKLGNLTVEMSEVLQEVRTDSTGVTVADNIAKSSRERHTIICRVLARGSDIDEQDDTLLEAICGRIRRSCGVLKSRRFAETPSERVAAWIPPPPPQQKVPWTGGLKEERLQRHRSQISPRLVGGRRGETLTRETSHQQLPRCTTDYRGSRVGTESYRYREQYSIRAKPPSGVVSFVPEEYASLFGDRRRLHSSSESLRGIDHWPEEGNREYYRR